MFASATYVIVKENLILERRKEMFEKITKKDKRTNLEKEIDCVVETMFKVDPASEEYTAMADNLEKLYKMKALSCDHQVSPDTIVVVAGNLLGIGLILAYEKANVITSKALGFIIKGRV